MVFRDEADPGEGTRGGSSGDRSTEGFLALFGLVTASFAQPSGHHGCHQRQWS